MGHEAWALPASWPIPSLLRAALQALAPPFLALALARVARAAALLALALAALDRAHGRAMGAARLQVLSGLGFAVGFEGRAPMLHPLALAFLAHALTFIPGPTALLTGPLAFLMLTPALHLLASGRGRHRRLGHQGSTDEADGHDKGYTL